MTTRDGPALRPVGTGPTAARSPSGAVADAHGSGIRHAANLVGTGVPVPPPAADEGAFVGPVGRWFARYPVLVDVLIATGYAVLLLGLSIIGALEQYTPVAAFGILQTLVLTVVVLLRRKAPVVLLGVALVVPTLARLADSGLEQDPPVITIYTYSPSAPLPVFDVVSSPRIAPVELVVVAILVVTISLQHAGRATVLSSTVAAVYALISYMVFGGEGARALDGAEAVGVVTVAALIGSNVRNRWRRLIELEDMARRLALERDQREQLAASAERTRIAREMHDVLAHSLSVMVTLADGADRTMDRDPDRARAALERLAATGREALADTRRMVGVLRHDAAGAAPAPTAPPGAGADAPLSPHPAVGDLSGLIASFRAAGLPVELTLTGPALPQDTALQLTIYRIVQECLTNVLRYAPGADDIAVEIASAPGHVTISVENGFGGTPTFSGGSGRGLIGIRERAAVFDGTVSAGPTPSGWRVEARLRVDSTTTRSRT